MRYLLLNLGNHLNKSSGTLRHKEGNITTVPAIQNNPAIVNQSSNNQIGENKEKSKKQSSIGDKKQSNIEERVERLSINVPAQYTAPKPGSGKFRLKNTP